MDDGDGQRDGERRSLAFAGALGADAAAVHLDELLDDGQPQAEPGVPPRGRSVGLAEAVEDVGQEFGLDADAGVDDADLDMRVDPLQQDLDLPPLGVNLTALASRFQTTCCRRAAIAGDRSRRGNRAPCGCGSPWRWRPAARRRGRLR